MKNLRELKKHTSRKATGGPQGIPPASSRCPDLTQISAPFKSTRSRIKPISALSASKRPLYVRLSPDFEKVPLWEELGWVWHFHRLRALLQWLRIYHQPVTSAPDPPLVSVFCWGDRLPIIWLQYSSSTSGPTGARRAKPLSGGRRLVPSAAPRSPRLASHSFTRAREHARAHHPQHDNITVKICTPVLQQALSVTCHL